MAKTKMASETIESKNKALVLEAFDTLFNKRDYAAAERFWSPNYIQHSAHIAPGREGLQKVIASLRMAASRGWEGPPPGSQPTSSGSKAAFLKSIGTFCRTRRPRPNLSAAFPCLATNSPGDTESNAIVLRAFDTLFNRSRRH